MKSKRLDFFALSQPQENPNLFPKRLTENDIAEKKLGFFLNSFHGIRHGARRQGLPN